MNFIDGAPNTKKTSESLFRNWIEPNLQVEPEKLIAFWEENLKPETVRKLVSIYKKWYRWKHGKNIEIKRSRANYLPKIKAWTKEEAEKALSVAKAFDSGLYKMMLVTLHTGIRKGELFGLTWEDVDFLNSRVNVQRSWDGPTKSGRPRSIPMSKEVEEVLLSCYNVGDTGKCFRACDPNDRLKRICKISEVREISWHSLRHTFATLALEARRSPKEVADVLGHANVSTTLDLYWSSTGRDMNLDFLPR